MVSKENRNCQTEKRNDLQGPSRLRFLVPLKKPIVFLYRVPLKSFAKKKLKAKITTKQGTRVFEKPRPGHAHVCNGRMWDTREQVAAAANALIEHFGERSAAGGAGGKS